MDTPLTRQLATFCHGLHYEQLPPEVIDRAKYFFLDYLGVAVRGSLSESSQPVYRLTTGLETPGAGTILGRREKTAVPYAALANGTSAHSLELGDTHPGGAIHLNPLQRVHAGRSSFRGPSARSRSERGVTRRAETKWRTCAAR